MSAVKAARLFMCLYDHVRDTPDRVYEVRAVYLITIYYLRKKTEPVADSIRRV